MYLGLNQELLVKASYHISNYSLAFLVVIIILWYLSIKIKYPFWNLHPVKHSYDYLNAFINRNKPPNIVYEFGVPVIKYYDPLRVKTVKYSNLDEGSIKQMVDFIQCNSIASEHVWMTTDANTLQKYVSSNPEESIVSLYKVDDDTLHGLIFARSYTINMNKKVMPCMLLDNICLKRDISDKKRILYHLLESHFVNQAKLRPETVVSLFKNDAKSPSCAGVCPVVKYKTLVYDLYEIAPKQYMPLPDHFLCEELKPLTWETFLDVCPFVLVGVPNLMLLQEAGEYFSFCLRRGEEIYGFYFFRDAHTKYEAFGGGDTLEFLGSLRNSESDELFYLGFVHAIRNILKSRAFSTLFVNCLSHNERLLLQIEKHTKSYLNGEFAYFLYNCVWHETPVDSSKCFML
jgi:hypothetical protein